jgi:hypothetical protein
MRGPSALSGGPGERIARAASMARRQQDRNDNAEDEYGDQETARCEQQHELCRGCGLRTLVAVSETKGVRHSYGTQLDASSSVDVKFSFGFFDCRPKTSDYALSCTVITLTAATISPLDNPCPPIHFDMITPEIPA